MQTDPLYPIVTIGEFWDRPSKDFFSKRVQFHEQVFIEGLDYRIAVLLDWIDECELTHGSDNVLLS